MDTVKNTYPAFQSPASELSAFSASNDFFTLSLKSGKIIHFTPDNKDDFLMWLVAHKIRDIHSDLNREELLAIANPERSWKRFFNFKKKRK